MKWVSAGCKTEKVSPLDDDSTQKSCSLQCSAVVRELLLRKGCHELVVPGAIWPAGIAGELAGLLDAADSAQGHKWYCAEGPQMTKYAAAGSNIAGDDGRCPDNSTEHVYNSEQHDFSTQLLRCLRAQ